jgi:urea transporter
MLLTLCVLYILIAQALVFDYNFTSTGMQAFNDMMTIPEFKSEFTTNLAMTFMFTILGVVYQIIQLSKSVKRQGAIK